MTGAHWHLMLNHLPLLGIPFGLALLLVSVRRLNHTLQRAGLTVLLLAGLAAGVTYLTGEPAEESLDRGAVEADRAIEVHEDAAGLGLAGALILAVAAGGTLWVMRRKPLGRGATVSLLVLGALASTALIRVAWLGGQIRHTELRGAAITAQERVADDDDHDRH